MVLSISDTNSGHACWITFTFSLLDSIIDPSEALVKKFNNSFLIPKSDYCDCISNDNIKFFVTAKSDEFSKKVKYWLEINKEIKLVNLRSND